MLSTEAFAEWSQKVVLFLHNTSKVAGEPYPNLLYEMGGVGFPTVSFLDADGRLLRQVGHIVTVAECEQAWQELQAWKTLRREVEAGGGADKERELFLLELDMGNRPFAEMQQRQQVLAEALSRALTPAEVSAVEQKMINLQFAEILRATPRDQQAVGGEKFLALFREHRIPNSSTETSFWQYLFAYAVANKDVALFRELLDWLRQFRADDARFQRYVRRLEGQLEQLEGGR